jgi:long-chain acyl-CoA synthetase
VQLGSRFGELGFDSLMYAELSSALDNAGIVLPESVDVTTLGHRRRAAGAAGARPGGGGARAGGEAVGRRRRRGDPRARRRVRRGQAGPGVGAARLLQERARYAREGRGHIPQHTSFIVAANHCSHLDMGAIKVALGDAGRGLTSLAAADYFFRNRYRRAYFKHFTNLVPMERSGSIRKSMDTAEGVLRQGRSMVVFPEGTRSVTGDMADFLPSLGYLALRAEVGVLPAHVAGTFDALPKGTAVPRSRDLTVSFGPFLSREWLVTLTDGLTAQEAWRLVAAFTQRVVENLRDGVATTLDADAARTRVGRKGAGPDRRAARAAPPRAEVGAMKKEKDARPLVLVTGGTGFLGAHLVRMLGSQNKARLRVLVHSAPPAC